MNYKQTYDSLHATTLDPEQHKRTCGYWFIVTNGAMAHTAFATRGDGRDTAKRRDQHGVRYARRTGPLAERTRAVPGKRAPGGRDVGHDQDHRLVPH